MMSYSRKRMKTYSYILLHVAAHSHEFEVTRCRTVKAVCKIFHAFTDSRVPMQWNEFIRAVFHSRTLKEIKEAVFCWFL